MPSPAWLTRSEGELVLSLLEQKDCRIVGSTIDELGFDVGRLVRARILQPTGTTQSVFAVDGAEGRFRDLARIDGPELAYFDTVDGMVVPPVAGITLYQLDQRWWLRWLADALDLVDAGRPTELVPDHVWEIGNLWVSKKTKASIAFARRVHDREARDRIRASLEKRSPGVVLTSTSRRLEATWLGRHAIRLLSEVLTSSGSHFEIDLSLVKTAILGGHGAKLPARLALSVDGSVLTIDGKQLRIRGPVQQEILRKLVDAHEAGTPIATKAILAHCSPSTDTLRKAFRGSPHWVVLEKYLRQDGGLSWIEI